MRWSGDSHARWTAWSTSALGRKRKSESSISSVFNVRSTPDSGRSPFLDSGLAGGSAFGPGFEADPPPSTAHQLIGPDDDKQERGPNELVTTVKVNNLRGGEAK